MDAWISVREAAALLGRTPDHVVRLRERGHLRGRRRSGVLELDRASVVDRAVDQERWISIAEAARVIGCSRYFVEKAVRAGQLTARSNGRQPSIDRASAEVYRAEWKTERRKKARRRARLARNDEERRQRHEATRTPPDDGAWLTTATAAVVLHLSTTRVRDLANTDRLPHVVKDGRLWFRREHIEQVAAARAFRMRVASDALPSDAVRRPHKNPSTHPG